MNKKTLFLLLAVVILFGTASMITLFSPNREPYRNEVEQIASGVVVSTPKLLKADMWIMEVELTRGGKDRNRLLAITSHPEQFRIGDKTELHSVLMSSKTGYRDMFYIASKSEK